MVEATVHLSGLNLSEIAEWLLLAISLIIAVIFMYTIVVNPDSIRDVVKDEQGTKDTKSKDC